MELIVTSIQFVADSAVDVLPIAVFLFAFQRLVIGGPMPNRKQIAVGFLFVIVGLGLFLVGLEQTLFPLGRLMAQQLTDPEFLHEAVGRGASALVWRGLLLGLSFRACHRFQRSACGTGIARGFNESEHRIRRRDRRVGSARRRCYRRRRRGEPRLFSNHYGPTLALFCRRRILGGHCTDSNGAETDCAAGV